MDGTIIRRKDETPTDMRFAALSLFVLATGVVGFQPLPTRTPQVQSVGCSLTQLFYQNKTEEPAGFHPGPRRPKHSDEIQNNWESYTESSSEPVLADPDTEEASWQKWLADNDLDDWSSDDADSFLDFDSTDFNEDGTIHDDSSPSLELLKSWTEEFWDTVDLAGGLTRVSLGVESLLSEDFVFTSPSIGPISKHDFIQLMHYYLNNGLDLASAIPDLSISLDGWHQDPHEPYRVWVVARYSGTHIGSARVPGSELTLTPAENNQDGRMTTFTSGPELQSFLWTTDKKILWQTMGYVGDVYTGSNQGYGGLDGLLVSMGLPPMYLDAVSPMRKVTSWFAQFQTDRGEHQPIRTMTRYSLLPQWWHDRKLYDLNIHK